MKFRNLRTHPRRRRPIPGEPITIDFGVRFSGENVRWYSVGMCPEGWTPIKIWKDGRPEWEATK
jgi:hypothetical protein